MSFKNLTEINLYTSKGFTAKLFVILAIFFFLVDTNRSYGFSVIDESVNTVRAQHKRPLINLVAKASPGGGTGMEFLAISSQKTSTGFFWDQDNYNEKQSIVGGIHSKYYPFAGFFVRGAAGFGNVKENNGNLAGRSGPYAGITTGIEKSRGLGLYGLEIVGYGQVFSGSNFRKNKIFHTPKIYFGLGI